MRKIFTLCLSMLMGATFAVAQDCPLEFVDAQGNVIADGSTWHVYDKEPASMFAGAMIKSGIYVQNNSAEEVLCEIDYQVTQISGGTFQICFPQVCTYYTSTTGLINSGVGTLTANNKADIQTEWVLQDFVQGTGWSEEATGTCTATLKVKQMYGGELVAEGAQITVIFHNDGTTGINAAQNASSRRPVAYYTLSGRRIGSPMKGLNIVKYSDGTIRKVVVK